MARRRPGDWHHSAAGGAQQEQAAPHLMLTGDLLEVMRRRAALRRLDCLLVFHKDGKPLGDFRKAWATACKAEVAQRLAVFVEDERSEEHTSELQSHSDLVCRLLLEKKKT